MVKKDKEKTTFVMPQGIFCYKVMSLKNVRTRNGYLFNDMMHQEVEKYIDDILAKTKKKNHMQVL